MKKFDLNDANECDINFLSNSQKTLSRIFSPHVGKIKVGASILLDHPHPRPPPSRGRGAVVIFAVRRRLSSHSPSLERNRPWKLL
jgi:hypothetical protein